MQLYEFDSFRFDARTKLLLQDGREIPLSKQTGDLLSLFVEGPGQVLLKEELVSCVWSGTSVEDNSLTFAIHQLRAALGRRKDGRSYIETLPKRGYRFVAAVNKIESEQVSSSAPVPRIQEPAGEERRELGPESVPKAQPHFLPTRRLVGFVLVGAIVLLGLAVGVFEFRLRSNPRLTVASYLQLTSDGHDKGGVLLTDGARIYFQERVSTGLQLASVAVQGGPTGTLPVSMQGTTIFDISPFRSEVLAARTSSNNDPDVWLMPLLGGPPRRVGALKADSATWSHDRTRIASILGTGLFISASDGTGTRKIATISEGASWLRWSPDEKTLRFSRAEYRNGEMQQTLWQINVDGTSLHQLLVGWNNPPRECCGTWTPDGRFYVFKSTRNGHTSLWAISGRATLSESDGSAPFLLSSSLIDFHDPAISSDGKQIFATGVQNRGELVSYNSELRDFVKFLGGISATWVIFAKSGQSVAYTDYPNLTIWHAKADGTEKTQITFSPLEVDGFSWSPDEKWFAIRARNPGGVWRIYLIPSQGGQPEPIMPGENEQGIPTWSADSARLCFGDVPAVFGKPSGTEMIHIYDLSTHKFSDLPGSHGLWTSRWSPDGRYIAALTIEGQKLELFDFSTNAWRSTNAAHVNNPNWTSDSRFIYYDTQANERTLQRLRISDGRVEQLANLRDYPSLAAWWSGLSPKNEPLLLRNLGSTEIYSLALEYK